MCQFITTVLLKHSHLLFLIDCIIITIDLNLLHLFKKKKKNVRAFHWLVVVQGLGQSQCVFFSLRVEMLIRCETPAGAMCEN